MLKRIIPADIIWFVIAIWLVFIIDLILVGVNFNQFGIRPRSIGHLPGILLSPFLHDGLYHLLSNSIPILILGSLLKASAGTKKLRSVMIGGAIGAGIGVWVFASNGLVVGASGMVFALLGFLFRSMLFSTPVTQLVISLSFPF